MICPPAHLNKLTSNPFRNWTVGHKAGGLWHAEKATPALRFASTLFRLPWQVEGVGRWRGKEGRGH